MQQISLERKALGDLRKSAFMPAPPMPQGAPPADPSMMQQGGAPPMDPSMMQQGAPPMDPSMMQSAPMDPSMMQQGGTDPNASAPVISPEMIDEIMGALEDMATQMQQDREASDQFRQQVEQALTEIDGQIAELDQRLAEVAGASVAPQPAM